MAVTASIVKTTEGTFIPATAYDAELLGGLKAGKPYKVEVFQLTAARRRLAKIFVRI